LNIWFVLLVIQAQPGDRRNWPVIREWAAGLRTKLLKSPPDENAGAAAR
jgi:hypothetical protein